MKLTTIVILISTFSMVASLSFSQDAKVDLNIENGTFKEVLLDISKQTNVRFLYNYKELDDSERVTLQVRDSSVDGVLNVLLRNRNLAYSVDSSVILIYKPDFSLRSAVRQQVDKKLVKGVVTNEKGELIIGATVLVKGTTYGVIANVNGEFSIQIPPNGAELQVFFVGYVPQTLTVRDRSDIRVVMKEDLVNWNEVVR